MGREIEIKIPLQEEQYNFIVDFVKGKCTVEGIINLDKDKPCPFVVKRDEYYSKYTVEAERRASGEPQVIRIRTDEIIFEDDNKASEKKAYFTIKRKTKQNGIEVNKEDETFVEDPSVIRDMLGLGGFLCWFNKEKRAYGAHCNSTVLPGVDFHVEVESVNNLKYVEIEVTQEEGDADKIKAALNDFVRQFGLNPEKRDIRSWVEIINNAS